MQPMTQALLSIGLFVLLLALVPIGLKWLQARSAAGAGGVLVASRVIFCGGGGAAPARGHS